MLNNNFARAELSLSVLSQCKAEGAYIWPVYLKVQNDKAESRPKEITVNVLKSLCSSF